MVVLFLFSKGEAVSELLSAEENLRSVGKESVRDEERQSDGERQRHLLKILSSSLLC